MAVRLALGAARARVVRQLLTESVLLAASAASPACCSASGPSRRSSPLAPANAPRVGEIGARRAGPRVRRAADARDRRALRPRAGAAGSRARRHACAEGWRPRQTGAAGARCAARSIVAEVALALMLLTGGGLLLQTFVRCRRADLGFNPENAPRRLRESAARGWLRHRREAPAPSTIRCSRTRRRCPACRSGAGVGASARAATATRASRSRGAPAPRSQSETPVTWYRLVSADYFDAMGMPIRRGRGFEAARSGARRSSSTRRSAGRYFPGEDPLGRRMRFGGPTEPWFTIVGVVADVKVRGAREARRSKRTSRTGS